MLALPPRYEAKFALGKGGGGEVWAVRDRVTEQMLALKVLAEDAGEGEILALVREAMALSGLEGLGVPRVVGFGSLPGTKRRYLVREMVEGRSLEAVLEEPNGPSWIAPLARASEQLTVLHRAGLLHGDIKPANIIVDGRGHATLVDLGLAAPWREGGARPQGLTPRYAAPELLMGDRLTVRAEVYALGATLAEALERRGPELDSSTRAALERIAARATEEDTQARYPSVDEFASALAHAARLAPSRFRDDAAWPVIAVESSAEKLRAAVNKLGPGDALAVEGPPGAGRTTLAHRLAWSLGVEGVGVAAIEAPRTGLTPREVVELEMSALPPDAHNVIIVIDDAHLLDDLARTAIAAAAARGARVVGVVEPGGAGDVAKLASGKLSTFVVPPLEARAAEELVQRVVPSLPRALAAHLVARVHARPGPLRAAIQNLAGKAIVSAEDIDATLASLGAPSPARGRADAGAGESAGASGAASADARASSHVLGRTGAPTMAADAHGGRAASSRPGSPTGAPPASPGGAGGPGGPGGGQSVAPPSRAAALERAERLVDTGRISEAEKQLADLADPHDDVERVRFAIARARLSLGRGDTEAAARGLDEVADLARKGEHARAWIVARARTHLRAGDYANAATLASDAARSHDDGLAADALSVRGLALAFTGDETRGLGALTQSLALANRAGDRRAEAIALGGTAIVHQRAGRNDQAREAYEGSLAAAEAARDASTVALTRLNLAGLARFEGDLAGALAHLEAAVDMGRRAGSLLAVQGALLSLANLDLYLGRYARARGSIDSLAQERSQLSPIQAATLFGLEAELAARTGEVARAATLYDDCARAWDGIGRPLDAAEARLESLLVRSRTPNAVKQVADLDRELGELRARMGDAGFREHEALAGIVTGSVALLRGDEAAAKSALDRAHDQATRAGRSEWAWLALEGRARLAASQGSLALARRDVDAALTILEETALKLPRDLREVFWNDPRRRSLREAHTVTQIAPSGTPTSSGAFAAIGSVIPSTGRTMSSAGGRTTTLLGAPLPAEDRLARIFEITRDLATEHEIGPLLSKVTDHAIALLGAERGFVVLANESGELEAHAARDRKGDDPHARFSRSVAEQVVRSGEPVIATSARDDERLAQAVSVHQLMIQSIACVPIRGGAHGERAIGALYLETRLHPGRRFQDELPTLAAFADQAAIAIENARLVSENIARAEELATANEELAAAKDKLSELLGRRTEQLAATRRDLKQARAELRSHFGYGGLVGTSAAMRKLYAMLDRIKDTDVPVLITGESGTGKEVVAKAIHASGPRAKKAFLGVNCGAIPANLLESELFGHVRGAFTGADRDRKGLFREAEGGTLLLDEIGELPVKMQAGLLRVLQEGSVRPVGGAKEEKVDVRIVAATNRDLSQMVAEGSFREDLYYRLHVIEVKIPALRERLDDLPALIDHFLSLFSARYRRERKSVDRDALRRLTTYDWPGNVRQLENVLLNAWLMGEGNELVIEDFELPEAVLGRGGASAGALGGGAAAGAGAGVASGPASARHDRTAGGPPSRGGSVSETLPKARTKAEFKDTERERILGALAACNWNRVQAARMIGVPRRTFYRRLKEFGIL